MRPFKRHRRGLKHGCWHTVHVKWMTRRLRVLGRPREMLRPCSRIPRKQCTVCSIEKEEQERSGINVQPFRRFVWLTFSCYKNNTSILHACNCVSRALIFDALFQGQGWMYMPGHVPCLEDPHPASYLCMASVAMIWARPDASLQDFPSYIVSP